ncbi:hypothetical protein PAPYR_13180 [Paratrimastix pyriformis]|uniref:Uncharacterized protein n=1 Tax=Paratrimastix pyriformis TaxID=342808 RepID=A0ABQ8U4B3_9EUKA|nr:hypothetical protein PAPYR_13180 [Paratrimastix pyriformis]
MNSIDWNQFHTPGKPLSIVRVRSARTPEMGRGLPGDQLVSRPAATHTAPGAPLPSTRPEGPDRPDRQSWTTMMCRAACPRRPRRQAQEGSEAPKGAAPVAKSSEAKEAKAAAPAPRHRPAGSLGRLMRPRLWRRRLGRRPQEDARPRHRHKHPAPVEISSSSDEGGRAPNPRGRAQAARPTDPDDFLPGGRSGTAVRR